MTTQDAARFATMFTAIVDNIARAILGKKRVIRLVLTALIAEGHILLEDAPGTGKTVLAKSLAASIEGTHSRIQFTPDLLPSDVTGVTIYDQRAGRFEFHRGPVFASIVLADEINRASPKTQSALLEVMEESKVTVDGVTYGTGRPFMVIATQNPIEQTGTYKLPEAQLDRFLMKTSLGYPDHDSVITILTGSAQRDRTASLRPVISGEDITVLSDIAAHVYLNPAIADYVARLGAATRNDPETRIGVSVRGCIALVRAAKVWAAAQGRNYVVPDDIKELAPEVFTHRIILDPEAEFTGVTTQDVMNRILTSVTPPAEHK
ncbi:AAA family ATPase [Jonesia denitrificans]|nr:MoxR family ATPase [Jonesia denitrificans]ASE10035.1 MoxR family ATPase [Jonesia denitrificans]QXB44648.1 MoxR family ATPase [Jonesia denitrificans]